MHDPSIDEHISPQPQVKIIGLWDSRYVVHFSVSQPSNKSGSWKSVVAISMIVREGLGRNSLDFPNVFLVISWLEKDHFRGLQLQLNSKHAHQHNN